MLGDFVFSTADVFEHCLCLVEKSGDVGRRVLGTDNRPLHRLRWLVHELPMPARLLLFCALFEHAGRSGQAVRP